MQHKSAKKKVIWINRNISKLPLQIFLLNWLLLEQQFFLMFQWVLGWINISVIRKEGWISVQVSVVINFQLSTSNSLILFFLVYFTVIHVQWIFIHAALVSPRAFIIPSHNNKISSSELLPGDFFHYCLNTDWRFSIFNYGWRTC